MVAMVFLSHLLPPVVAERRDVIESWVVRGLVFLVDVAFNFPILDSLNQYWNPSLKSLIELMPAGLVSHLHPEGEWPEKDSDQCFKVSTQLFASWLSDCPLAQRCE